MQQKIPTVIIIGAGLGGLTLYHALIKNKDKKEFNVKIFERESSPQGIRINILYNHNIFFFDEFLLDQLKHFISMINTEKIDGKDII
jgi:cation diffusion facilitator CzcD-associated flavoprotein CzcO